jgi:hypothetical protein
MAAVEAWTCTQCTFENTDALACSICGFANPNGPTNLVLWEWYGEDAWIPYDSATCIQLESAYQARVQSVHLAHGYFQGRSNYCVQFNRDGDDSAVTEHLQLNTRSFYERRVRRKGPPRPPPRPPRFNRSLWSSVQLKDEALECPICLEEFTIECVRRSCEATDCASVSPERTTERTTERTHKRGLFDVLGDKVSHLFKDGKGKNRSTISEEKTGQDADPCLQNFQCMRLVNCKQGCEDKHYFHQACIADWLRRDSLCPVCRYDYPNAWIVPAD